MHDLLIRNASLPNGRKGIDIAIKDGKIADVAPGVPGEASKCLDLDGWLVTPPFVNPHFHLDATLSTGRPRVNQSGTLLEGIEIWGELSPTLTVDDIYERARELCHWSIARGCLAIRSHVDITDNALLAVEALLSLRDDMAPWIDLQLVAFPQYGYFRHANSRENVFRALDRGIDVVGGIPHFERTMDEGGESVAALCRIAADRGLLVDMHCDETDDPNSRHVERLAAEAHRLGLHGRVAGSHLTSMHSMDNYYVSKLLPLIVEAGVAAVANPLINIAIQGRHDTYPKRRGLTRVKEMVEAGIPVALGHDCVMDPWYSLGSHDMLEVVNMAVHVGHMTGVSEMEAMFAGVTTVAAEVMHLEGYGLEPGCNADLVVLQARSPVEAIRLRANRLYVLRRGKVIAESAPQVVSLALGDERKTVDFIPAGSQ
ncbi:MAG: amidohydrolase family protein [Rhodobacteraceae bacterium]|nr:amidohydrolase family protein [Paracoccaceae bacterium]MCY4137484.1 amidohydrolase family protein [Paracoccaceae bacterium]